MRGRAYRGAERREAERRRGPRRLEDLRGATDRRIEQRRHVRHADELRVRIFRPSRGRRKSVDFSAVIDTRDISVGGAYLQSSFFLREGTELEIEIALPHREEPVRASMVVVHVMRDGTANKPSGFAVRFLRFRDDSEILLRAHLAGPELYEFVKTFLASQPKGTKLGVERLVQLLMRWEMYRDTL